MQAFPVANRGRIDLEWVLLQMKRRGPEKRLDATRKWS